MNRNMMKRNVQMDKNEPHPKGGLSALVRFCKPYFPAIAVALVCAVGGTIFTIIGPDKLSELTDVISAGLMGGIDMAAVTRIAATLAIMYGLSFLLSVLQGQLMTGVTQKASQQLRESISKKVNRLPIDYYNKTTFGISSPGSPTTSTPSARPSSRASSPLSRRPSPLWAALS